MVTFAIIERFNEAPIHESGKSCSAAGLRGRSRSFNEAPIHESGKSKLRKQPTTVYLMLQ